MQDFRNFRFFSLATKIFTTKTVKLNSFFKIISLFLAGRDMKWQMTTSFPNYSTCTHVSTYTFEFLFFIATSVKNSLSVFNKVLKQSIE